MPGLCLASAADHPDRDALAEALGNRRHFEWYETGTVHDDDGTWMGYATYRGYPTRTFESGGITCYLEGHLYDGATTDDDLVSVARALLEGSTDGVADWVAGVDGDFVLCAVDRGTGDAAVLNDVFGRLPLYCTRRGDEALVSRDVGFHLDLLDVSYDRIGIAETLLFGYSLGTRTLWNEVDRVPPGSAIRLRDGEATTVDMHDFDFEKTTHDDRTTEENAAAMAESFVEACRRRGSAGGETVVSLSGGHDSRAVATGVDAAGSPFSAATFRRGNGGASADARVAAEVAEALGVDWQGHELPPVRGAEMKTLLRIQSGLNHLGMGFILPFLSTLRDRHGPGATYLTGDGGDKAVPDLSPPRSLEDVDDLVDYTVTHNEVFSASEASDLAGIDRSRLLADVRNVLTGYPERDLGRKYVHFLVHERGFNWLFEGEDRNRSYLWSTTPFYSVPFFEYAMNVPDEQKSRNALYRAFLSELWPPSVTFEDADFGTPMSSRRYDLLQYGLETLDRHPRLAAIARTVYRGEVLSKYHRNVQDLFRQQRSRCESLATVFDGEALDAVVGDRSGYGRQQVFTLLTLTTAVDHQACGTPLSAIPDDAVFEGE